MMALYRLTIVTSSPSVFWMDRLVSRQLYIPLSGKFLQSIVAMTNSKRILEIGMFTGYAALACAEALPEDGSVTTLELDPYLEGVAKEFFSRSPHGKKISVKIGKYNLPMRSENDLGECIYMTIVTWLDFVVLTSQAGNCSLYFGSQLLISIPNFFCFWRYWTRELICQSSQSSISPLFYFRSSVCESTLESVPGNNQYLIVLCFRTCQRHTPEDGRSQRDVWSGFPGRW